MGLGPSFASRIQAGESLSVLDGVPVAVKDEVDQRPYPTTVGTSFLGDMPATEDATVVKRLREAGCLLIGKTNMYEIGINPNESSFSTIVLDMSYESNWNGTIRQIRLDPSNAATSGTVDIDFILITDDISAEISDTWDHDIGRIYPVPAQE